MPAWELKNLLEPSTGLIRSASPPSKWRRMSRSPVMIPIGGSSTHRRRLPGLFCSQPPRTSWVTQQWFRTPGVLSMATSPSRGIDRSRWTSPSSSRGHSLALATDPVIDSVSTFLMGEVAPSDVPVEEAEPEVGVRGAYELLPAGVQTQPPRMLRSASRLDLVRYAAASGDFNPVHFDHRSAIESGFPGVLVHGLLMGSWLLQSVAALSSRPDPIAFAKMRFRNPLRPGVTSVVEAALEDSSDGTPGARGTLTAGEVELVSARIRLSGS